MIDFVKILMSGYDKLIEATQQAEAGTHDNAEQVAHEGFSVFEEVYFTQ